ncbi:N-acetylmuramoyl-L-alanine amidase [Evansella sp. AB-rgal1]|uniref:N-acetylmuramoyl-L-alanine amidase family protein n=1 Tax=Evansella sp. AB-rgal1 TaxID=3242696 RepID=UPI00359E821C
MFKLYLDPGHGGSDTGATGNGLVEKEIALDIALRIRNILEQEYENIEVRMSRTSDVDVSLEERTNDANSWGADYFLSIHVNGFDGIAQGYEDYIHNSLSDSSDTAQYREVMHEEIIEVNDLYNRGKKKANFHVLRETTMSALLTENGFIDNEEDAEKLADSEWRQEVARGHVNGLEKTFDLNTASNSLHRVIVDGEQVGAYEVEENVLNEVRRNLDSSERIVIERVR